MDILILGNGFDLAHELKTSYKDFLEYCNPKKSLYEFIVEKLPQRELCETNLWVKHFITRQKLLGENWIDLEKEIYEVIKNLKSVYALTKQGVLVRKYRKVLWIEKGSTDLNLLELGNNIREPHLNEKLSKDGLEDPYRNYIVNFYIENFKDFVELLYKHLRGFTQIFQPYLSEIVLFDTKKYEKYDFALLNKVSPVHVVNFNYTDTYERLYKHKRMYSDFKSEYIYIHGKIENNSNCNLVLGTHSFYNYLPNSLNEEIPVDFNVFKKHNQRHKYCTIDSYQEFLKILKPENEKNEDIVFHIIGHSLDETDHSILRHLLNYNEKAKINIYYHDEEAQQRLITNITEIISEENVISRVRLIYQHDPLRGILIPKKVLEKNAVTTSV